MIKTQYDRKTRLWMAYLADEQGNQIGDCDYSVTENLAVFNLGMNKGIDMLVEKIKKLQEPK